MLHMVLEVSKEDFLIQVIISTLRFFIEFFFFYCITVDVLIYLVIDAKHYNFACYVILFVPFSDRLLLPLAFLLV